MLLDFREWGGILLGGENLLENVTVVWCEQGVVIQNLNISNTV